MPHVALSGIGKTYTDGQVIQVLKDLNLDVADKEVISIIGSNGSGKSTILSLLMGIEKPSEGKLHIEPHTSKLGFVFQNYRDSLMPWATALENVMLPLEKNRHLTEQTKEDKAAEALRLVGLEKFEDYYIHQLSGGMAQLVALARALVVEPELLLLDEPFSALDYNRSLQMQEMLAKLWEERNMTVLMVSHNLDEAVYLSDKIVIMSGRPGTVKRVIPNQLPRPRTFEVRLSDEFSHLQKEVLRHIEPYENHL